MAHKSLIFLFTITLSSLQYSYQLVEEPLSDSNFGPNAELFSIDRHHAATARIFYNHFADLNHAYLLDQIASVAFSGDVEWATEVIEHQWLKHFESEESAAAESTLESLILFVACGAGLVDAVQDIVSDMSTEASWYLCAIGEAPWGHTNPSIVVAAERGHVDVVRCLFAAILPGGAQFDLDTFLLAAVHIGSSKDVKLLLSLGARPDAKHLGRRDACESCLAIACDRADVAIVQALLKASAKPNRKLNSMRPRGVVGQVITALHAALGARRLSNGIEMERLFTPYHCRSIDRVAPIPNELTRRLQVVRMLLTVGAKPTADIVNHPILVQAKELSIPIAAPPAVVLPPPCTVTVVVEHDCEGALRVFRNVSMASQVVREKDGRVLGQRTAPGGATEVWCVCRDRLGETDQLWDVYAIQDEARAQAAAREASKGASYYWVARRVTLE
jgi:hypothetical protein